MKPGFFTRPPEHDGIVATLPAVTAPPPAVADAPMTELETKTLHLCEETIRENKKAFLELGHALARIRDERLYRNDFATFEEYCQERWGFTSRHARNFITSDETVESIKQYQAAQSSGSEPAVAVTRTADEDKAFKDDEDLLANCLATILEENEATLSILISRFRLGFFRACKIMDELIARGHVGPWKGPEDLDEPHDILSEPGAALNPPSGTPRLNASAARTASAVKSVPSLPETESQARPLARLPKAERGPAWEEARASAKNGKVTAKHVAAVVEKRKAGAKYPRPNRHGVYEDESTAYQIATKDKRFQLMIGALQVGEEVWSWNERLKFHIGTLTGSGRGYSAKYVESSKEAALHTAANSLLRSLKTVPRHHPGQRAALKVAIAWTEDQVKATAPVDPRTLKILDAAQLAVEKIRALQDLFGPNDPRQRNNCDIAVEHIEIIEKMYPAPGRAVVPRRPDSTPSATQFVLWRPPAKGAVPPHDRHRFCGKGSGWTTIPGNIKEPFESHDAAKESAKSYDKVCALELAIKMAARKPKQR